MREIRIYQAGEYGPGSQLTLSPEAALHVGVVLRLQPGHKLTLFNGNNHEYQAEILAVSKKNVQVKILSQDYVNRENTSAIHLVQAVSKFDRMDVVMQKAVELGATSITPMITEYCAVKLDKDRLEKKCRQWQAIAISAAEQSGRNQITPILSVVDFGTAITTCISSVNLIAHPCAPGSWNGWSVAPGEAITLLIGPEGGFSPTEVQAAMQKGFIQAGLGPRLLRTETAAIAALALLQNKMGEM